MKTMHESRLAAIERQLFKMLFSTSVEARQQHKDSMSIILMAKSKTEWKI